MSIQGITYQCWNEESEFFGQQKVGDYRDGKLIFFQDDSEGYDANDWHVSYSERGSQ